MVFPLKGVVVELSNVLKIDGWMDRLCVFSTGPCDVVMLLACCSSQLTHEVDVHASLFFSVWHFLASYLSGSLQKPWRCAAIPWRSPLRAGWGRPRAAMSFPGRIDWSEGGAFIFSNITLLPSRSAAQHVILWRRLSVRVEPVWRWKPRD